MDLVLWSVLGVLAIVTLGSVAPRVGVAVPLLLVALGTAVSFLPFVPAIEVDPEVILGVVLPALLYSAAVNMPTMDFRRNFRTISGLSVILVVVSSVVVGWVVSAIVPAIDLATGIALGAIISPTDAVATSIVRMAGVSPRIVTVLEGESMLNDASALVLLRSALAAIATSVSLWHVAGSFVYAVVVAVAVGWAVGRLNLTVRARLRQATSSVAISLVSPLVAYLPAEHLHASGLVAAVTAGLVTGHGAPARLGAEDRLTESAVWRTLELLLEGAVFLIMGLQLYGLVEDVREEHRSITTAVAVGILCALLVLILRAAFVAFSIWGLARRARRDPAMRERLTDAQQRIDRGELRPPPRRPGAADDEMQRRIRHRTVQMSQRISQGLADLDYLAAERFGWREGVVLVWAGMRGAVTVAAAQSLPRDVPARSFLELTAYVVAGGTLLVQGGTLSRLVPALHLDERANLDPDAERLALRGQLTAAAQRRLDSPQLRGADGKPYSPNVIETMRRFGRPIGDPPDEEAAGGGLREYASLRLDLIEAQRAQLLELRDVGAYSSATMNWALVQLDAEQLGIEIRMGLRS